LPPDFKRFKVKYFREYDIPIAGLGLGEHLFSFEIGPTFFKQLEYAVFEDGNVQVDLMLIKQETLFELKFKLKGFVVVTCSRCLDELNYQIEGANRLIIKYGAEYEEESDEVLILPYEQHHFDVSHLIYEYISLLIPFSCSHPETEERKSACNPEMIKRLEQHKEEATQTDPRWDLLKNYNKENKE
jgi:uncharacterized protein